MMLRLFVEDCAFISSGAGVFFSGLMRKKLSGGGVTGGLIFGRERLAIGLGSIVWWVDGLIFDAVSPTSGFDLPGIFFCGPDVKSGGRVWKALSSFFGPAGISAPQCGQNRYSRVSTSGSCLLHLGQDRAIYPFTFSLLIFVLNLQNEC